MRINVLLTSLLLSAGCGLESFNPAAGQDDSGDTGPPTEIDADTDADADTDTDADADSDTDTDAGFVITDIDPNYGTTLGGQDVMIEGGPFAAGTEVRFGASAGTVISQSNYQLMVRTPSFSAPGDVDVTVTSGGDSATQTSAFSVYKDGTGLAGAIGEFYWIQYVGDYWGGTAPAPEGGVWWAMVDPFDYSYQDFWTSSLGTCVSEYNPTISVDVYELGPSSSRITSGSASVSMNWSSSSLDYSATVTSSSNYKQGATYSLDSMSPTNGWPDFSVSELLKTPSALNVTSPSINSAALPQLNRSNFRINWTGGSGADFVVMQLSLTNANWDAFVETVTCAVPNNGSFQVPSTVWNSWAGDRAVYMLIGAATEGEGIIDVNNAYSRVSGVHFLQGAGVTSY